MYRGILYKYGEHLPLTDKTPIFSLGEGNTPLVRSRHIEKIIGCQELYFKLEGCNPTGSFKDRGMVVAVAKAMEEGSQSIICASTGNTSAAAAAYAAHSAMPSTVLVPKNAVSAGKLAQTRAYGTNVLMIDGNFDYALSIVRTLASRHPITLVNSINPYRLEGQKTAAFEVVDELGGSPDLLCIPVGNAGNITAYWKGFGEYYSLGKVKTVPRMMGFQAYGAAPIVLGHPIEKPTTVASAISIGNPANWEGATKARDESGGGIYAVGDDEILNAYHRMATEEGIFCEPASAASVAGLMKLSRMGWDLSELRVVCVITGSGLKDPELAARAAKSEIVEVSSRLEDVEAAVLNPIT